MGARWKSSADGDENMSEESNYQKIFFEGNEYILVNNAITTKFAFEKGIQSFAHIFPDGMIRQFGIVIGAKEDIVFTEEYIEVDPDFDEFFNGIFGGSWNL